MLEIGDLIFVRGDTFLVSSAIKTVLHSPYSHVAVAVGSNTICEIDVFRRMKFTKLTYSDYDVYRVRGGLTAQQKLEMLAFLQEKCKTSKGYDWGMILEICLRRLWGWEIVIDQKNRYICSEIVDEAFASIGIDLVPWCEAGDVTPADLLESSRIDLLLGHPPWHKYI